VFDKRWLSPHESLVSMLWKFARLNALPGHFLAAQVAHELVDPYEGIEAYREAENWRQLQQALDLPLKTMRLSVLSDHRRAAASPICVSVPAACDAATTASSTSWSPCTTAPFTTVGCKSSALTALKRLPTA
jgi:hypothetical protein